jgi:hypothetical protein
MPLTRLAKSVPTDLALARLHLEDIDEIHAIFIDMIRAVALREGSQQEPEIIYRVGDLTSSDILSFQARMKRAHELDLDVVAGFARLKLSISKYSCFWYESAGLDEAQKWSIHNRLKEIFDSKKLHLRILTDHFSYGFVVFPSLVLITIAEVVDEFNKHLPHPWLAVVAALFSTALLGVFFFGSRSRPVVVLRYSSDLRAEQEERKWDIVKIAIGGLLGACLGVVGTLVVQHFQK